jgi:hypothetical protein
MEKNPPGGLSPELSESTPLEISSGVPFLIQ